MLTATDILFRQGMADPRGGEYRAIVVHIGNVWQGDGGTVETHGWVLPETTPGKQFAVCWNGLVYPVEAVKGKADLHKDISELITGRQGVHYIFLADEAIPEKVSVSLDYRSLVRVAYLLRVGENDLARSLYRRWEADHHLHMNTNDQIRKDPYLQMATEWAWAAYDRAVCAHMRGADRLALADTDLLVRIQPEIEAESEKHGFIYDIDGTRHEANTAYVDFLGNLPDLRQDSRRRVAETPRTPFDPRTLDKLPQNVRIAELVRRLDEVGAVQMGQPGGVNLVDSPMCAALIAEGDAAIDPLLDVMEKDDRLIRSVSFGRSFFRSRNLLTVKAAAFACFAGITNITQIGGPDAHAVPALRQWWEKNRHLSPVDRWFAQLADDGPPAASSSSTSGQDGQADFYRLRANVSRWEEAAGMIVERTNVDRRGRWIAITPEKPGGPRPPFKGEALRERRSPSVSDLLARRAREVSEPTEGKWGFDFVSGATLALMLYEWDPNGQETLPTLREMMRRCLDFQKEEKKRQVDSDQYQMGGRIARLTLARVRLGDTDAAEEYATWLKTISPGYLGFNTRSALLALWMDAENPAMRRITDFLFSETGSAPSAWNRLLTDPQDHGNGFACELLASEMLRLPAFQELVARRLADRKEAGTVMQKEDDPQTRSFAWMDGSREGPTPPPNVSWPRQSLRICDRCALALQALPDAPRFDPLASVDVRDAQCAALAEYVRRHGAEFHRSPIYPRPLYMG